MWMKPEGHEGQILFRMTCVSFVRRDFVVQNNLQTSPLAESCRDQNPISPPKSMSPPGLSPRRCL